MTLDTPWGDIVDMLDARATRLERADAHSSQPRTIDGEHVEYTDSLAGFGIGKG